MKRFFIKALGIIMVIGIPFTSFADKTIEVKEDIVDEKEEKTDLEKRAAIEEKVKPEIERVFGKDSEKYFRLVGSYYWENNHLKLGIKYSALTSEEKKEVESLKENLKSVKGFTLVGVKYSMKEQKEISELVEKAYLEEGGKEPFEISIGGRGAKVVLNIKSIEESIREKLKQEFKDKLIIRVDNNLEKPSIDDEVLPFIDLEKDAWYTDTIVDLYNANLLKGYEDKTIKPENLITREEAAMIASEIIQIPVMEEKKYDKNDFIDVDKDRWSYNAIKILRDYEIIKGRTEKEFFPKELLTREEAVVIADRILGFREIPRMEDSANINFTDKDDISDWAIDSIESLNYNKYIQDIQGYEDGSFRPKNNINRAEFFKIMNEIRKGIIRQNNK